MLTKNVSIMTASVMTACCLLLEGGLAHAQTFPFRVSSQLSPPYSLKLSDYASPTVERIAFNVFADISRPELQVKFRLKIEGQNVTIVTRPEFNPPPVSIRGGVPERFTGYDLAQYFNPANLNFQGITRQQFEKTGALPEGLYRFQIEVLEYNRGTKISNTGTALAWLILNDPPIVNLPRQNEKLKPQSPQNVLMQWTPRHTGSPNSAFTTEYEIIMVEVWPATRNPNDAILSSPPIFKTTTRSTSIVYGPSETPLELGRRYAFRVQAKSIAGVEELDLFKNKGYSEVISFVYGDACDLPTGIRAESLNSTRFAAYWDALPNHTAFKLRYKLANDATAQWFETTSVFNEIEITSLRPNTKYEFQVAGQCGFFEGQYSATATATTKEAPPIQYSCGLPMENFNLDPASLVASLRVGDIIQAGDFDVQLVRVSGSNGTFSGEGVVSVPYLNNGKVKVEFSSIMVNKDLRMIRGYMNVTGAGVDIVPDEVSALMNDLNETLDKLDDALDKAETVLDEIDAALALVDNVLNEIMVYLPDDIVQEISASRSQITAARESLSAATTDAEKEQAKTELKAAKQRLKEAAGDALKYYAEAIKNVIKILVQVVKELKEESQREEPIAEQDLQRLDGELTGYLPEGYDGNASSDEPMIMIYSDTDEVSNDEINEPRLKAFTEKTREYFEANNRSLRIRMTLLFVAYYSNEANLNQLAKALKLNGVQVLEAIAIRLKNRESEGAIVAYVKDELKQMIINFTVGN